MGNLEFKKIDGNSKAYYLGLLFTFLLFMLAPFSAFCMFKNGHYVTNMDNQIPWGMPIVMAIYLIGASAGSLVMSAMSSVFGRTQYKPFSRMAALLSVILIVAALLSIIMDWGRPDRLFIPFFHFQPRSMFSINAFLYSAYILLGFVYLRAMFNQDLVAEKNLGLLAVILAVLVHSGTGAIFGFVYVRDFYHSALLPPSFVVAALSSGTALMIVIIYFTFKIVKRRLDEQLIHNLGFIMGSFIVVVFYFIAVEIITRAYAPKNAESLYFMLIDKNHISFLFWFVFVFAGLIIPGLTTLQKGTGNSTFFVVSVALLHLVAVLAERYLIVLPAQMLPLELLPGKEIISAFNDGHIELYHPSLIEITYSIGLVGFVLFTFMLAIKLWPMLPVEARYQDILEEAAKMKEEIEAGEATNRDAP